MDDTILFFILSLICFIIVILLLKYVYHYFKNNSHNRLLNMEEYLPLEELQTLKQVSYLILITIFVINIFYQFTFYGNDLTSFTLYDIVTCLFAITLIKIKDIRSYLLIFCLMPFDSLNYLLFNSTNTFIIILSVLHLIALFYVVGYFYKRFKTYTKSNGLGYTILLLFNIIFISFLWTSFVENVNLLDSLLMVSNAFTSNGYAILGSTTAGKINAIFLVWAGYVISGAGTATLTVALMKRHYDKKFDELKELIEEMKENK